MRCENCGKELISASDQEKYCSKSCAATVNNKLFPKRSFNRTQFVCITCGKTLVGWRQKKYCSKTCSDNSPSKNRSVALTKIECLDCGKETLVSVRGTKRLCNQCSRKRYKIAFKEKCLAVTGKKCTHCNAELESGKMAFHHIDESTKNFEIGPYQSKPWNEVLEELSKCIVLCSPCHTREHLKRRKEKYLKENKLV